MRRPAVLLLDTLIAAGLIVLTGIAISGGGTAQIGGRLISFRSVGNGLIALYILAFVRFLIGRHTAFFGGFVGRSSTPTDRAWNSLAYLDKWLRAHRTRGFLLVVVVLSVAVRLANAAIHPGFFSGDDVEIHEMTFAALQNAAWSAWNLRSPFYPLGFIFPVQFVASATGVTDPALLVFAGRCVVAATSPLVILLVYRAAHSRLGHAPAAWAALITATSALLVTFGSTELPRPLSTVFVLSAFLLLGRMSAVSVIAAGIAIGVAAAMRFSEIVFVVPALLQLALERRWRDTALFGFSAAIAGFSIQVTVDYLYWGQAFASARAIVDYTLARGLSSRGYEPLWYYLTHITAWTDYLIFSLAIYGITARSWRWAVWAGAPLVLLSLLPHKEPRYLIPAFPFMAILAAAGLARLTTQILATSSAARTAAAGWVVAGLIGSLLFQLSGMHVRRSDDAVRLARNIRDALSTSSADVLLVEQPWRLGGRIYLGFDSHIVDADANQLQTTGDLTGEIARVDATWVLLRQDTCRRLDCAGQIDGLGLTRAEHFDREQQSGYVVMRRRAPAALR